MVIRLTAAAASDPEMEENILQTKTVAEPPPLCPTSQSISNIQKFATQACSNKDISGKNI